MGFLFLNKQKNEKELKMIFCSISECKNKQRIKSVVRRSALQLPVSFFIDKCNIDTIGNISLPKIYNLFLFLPHYIYATCPQHNI